MELRDILEGEFRLLGVQLSLLYEVGDELAKWSRKDRLTHLVLFHNSQSFVNFDDLYLPGLSVKIC